MNIVSSVIFTPLFLFYLYIQSNFDVKPIVSTTFSSRKKIEKLEVIHSLSLLIVLSGGELTVHDMNTLKQVKSSSLSSKKVGLFCINQIGSGSVNRICVAGMV